MKRIVKGTALVLGGLILLGLLAGAALYPVGLEKLTRSYPEIPVETVKPTTDPDAIEHGKHIAIIWGCTQCHGDNLSGTLLVDNPLLGTIPAPNLTAGKGGIAPSYADADWIRAVRHGVKPDGRVELIMSDRSAMSDRDLGDLIAYLDQTPPIDSGHPSMRLGSLLPPASGLGLFTPAADLIDHNSSRPADAAPGIIVEYGRYLYALCVECHPTSSAGKLGKWTQEEFIRMLRMGVMPNGKQIGRAMPPKRYGEMDDTELGALWLYLHSAGATTAANRYSFGIHRHFDQRHHAGNDKRGDASEG